MNGNRARSPRQRLPKRAFAALVGAALLAPALAGATDLCGDLDADGVLELYDEQRLRSHLAGNAPPLWVREEMRCNVADDPSPGRPGDAIQNGCSILDWAVGKRARLGEAPGTQQLCAAGSALDCCTAHAGVGCDDTAVAECVCASDAACCGTGWDSVCAASVTALGCGSCFGEPGLRPLADVVLLSGSPLHIPLEGHAPAGEALTFEASIISDPNDPNAPMVTPSIPSGNRDLRISVADTGDMVFQLFEGRASRATARIAQLAQSGFYDGVTFHRVIDDFVIQGGDPTGTGAGGSTLGDFDDQFHVDLQHNRTGLLSMAKSFDDTNDSQFFITEGPQRHLDFNHTIFGLLLRGEDVRERISGVATDASNRPIVDVVMESTEVFTGGESAVLMLQAPEGESGSATIVVTARAENTNEVQRSFVVTVVPDTVNGNPFLADIPPVSTPIDTQVTFQLQAIDAEGDPSFYLDQWSLDGNGLPVPVVAHPDLYYEVDFYTGLVTVTPTNGLSGVQPITVATGVFLNAIDYQVVPIQIGP